MDHFDTYLPVGCDCHPAHYLKVFGLRTESYPLDWMIFGADALIHLFQTDFSDFFSSVVEEASSDESSCRRVRDRANGIISLHHFPKEIEISDTLDAFHATMRLRYARLRERLMSSKSLLMLGYQHDREDRVEDMILAFSELYPHLNIHLLNIRDTPEMDSSDLLQKRRVLNDQLTLTWCYFNNSYDTDAQSKFDLWGNAALWQRVLL